MPNANVNKVMLSDGTVPVDLTDTTATADDVAEGKVFYAASGARTLGTASGGGAVTTWYGTCSTAAATAAKVVVCDGFELVKGAIIGIFFSIGNAEANPTLNVNSTGAKNIRIGTTAPNTTTNGFRWGSQTVLFFMYDGTYFSFISAQDADDYNAPHGTTTWYGTSATSAGTAAKTAISTYFTLSRGSIIAITFTYGNTVNGAITLNVNSTGAKTVYVNNAATSSSNPLLWDAKETLTFMYSGSYYYLVARDKTPTASASQLGGVKVGSGLSINASGVLSAGAYTLPTASASTLGGVKVGSGLSIDSSGVLSASGGGGGGGSSSWETVSYVEVGTFSGSVLTDGHLCVITSEPGQTTVDDSTWYILSNLPKPVAPVFINVLQEQGANITTLFVDSSGSEGILYAYDPDTINPEYTFDAFTIIYPVASS